MPDVDLFTHLAEIAGVFVGFGALIALREGRPSDWRELMPMRNVVALGMLTVAAALAPVTMAGLGLEEHRVWVASSLVVLVGMVMLFVANAVTTEYRTYWGSAATLHWSWTVGFQMVLNVFFMVLVPVSLLVVVLGLAPDLDAGIYASVVVLLLLGAGWALLTLVFAQRDPDRHPRHHALTRHDGGAV